MCDTNSSCVKLALDNKLLHGTCLKYLTYNNMTNLKLRSSILFIHPLSTNCVYDNYRFNLKSALTTLQPNILKLGSHDCAISLFPMNKRYLYFSAFFGFRDLRERFNQPLEQLRQARMSCAIKDFHANFT